MNALEKMFAGGWSNTPPASGKISARPFSESAYGLDVDYSVASWPLEMHDYLDYWRTVSGSYILWNRCKTQQLMNIIKAMRKGHWHSGVSVSLSTAQHGTCLEMAEKALAERGIETVWGGFLPTFFLDKVLYNP